MAQAILQFNWRALRKLSTTDILRRIQITPQPNDSYIMDIYKLITNPLNATDDEIYIYLELASMRNFYNLKYMNDNKLKTKFVDDYDIEKLKMNTLLKIENNEIIFKYEEI